MKAGSIVFRYHPILIEFFQILINFFVLYLEGGLRERVRNPLGFLATLYKLACTMLAPNGSRQARSYDRHVNHWFRICTLTLRRFSPINLNAPYQLARV
jgi:hypothetical protein